MLIVGALMGKGKEADGAYRPLSVYTESARSHTW